MKKSGFTPVLAGHPFAPIGMGEVVRSAFRSFRAAGHAATVRDIYGMNRRDPDIELELGGHLVRDLSNEINIFYINGNEVTNTLSHIGNMPSGAYNVIYPAWELSHYPHDWAVELERFDEVWTMSGFVFESIQKAVSKPVFHMPLASQVDFSYFLDRRYFNIPEHAYVFLFFFDFTSYIARKNPDSVLKSFEKVCEGGSSDDSLLVVKMNSVDQKQDDYRRFIEKLDSFRYRDRIIVIDKTLGDNEIKNLVRCCDCFVSLHRSEGFGRGIAEAMYLGKPVVATGYSGNLDFMNEENSCTVNYKLVPVEEGQYPYAAGQLWAEPDIDHAVSYMRKLLSDRDYGRRLGSIASLHIRKFFSYRATGLRYIDRIMKIR